MSTTTACEFGDVVLVSFPFSDQTTTKRRPAIVVSSHAYHRDHLDQIVIAITSQVRSRASVGEFSIARWKEAGLLKPSVVKPLLTTLERGVILRKLGRLQEEDLQTLRQALQAILG